MVFATSATERMRIDVSGTYKSALQRLIHLGKFLMVLGHDRFTDGIYQTLDIRETGGIELQNPNNGFISFKGSSVERMRIRANGNVILHVRAMLLMELSLIMYHMQIKVARFCLAKWK